MAASSSKLRIVGIMSGTSLDGVDYVLCDIHRQQKSISIHHRAHAFSPFSHELKERLQAAVRRKSKVDELSDLHHDLGRFYAQQLERHLTKLKWKIDLVGLHGQTVFHNPPVSTMQIGEPTYLAHLLSCPVVSDFRAADLATGGQAAPLAPLFHWAAFADHCKKAPLTVQNLGGISNVTFLPRAAKANQVLAFDTGPSNMLIDLAASHLSGGEISFDKDGAWAAQGVAHPRVIQKWMQHPFLTRKPPKSTGREEFGEIFFQQAVRDFAGEGVHRKEDQLQTLTEFTAQSISHAYRTFLPQMPSTILVCGGGAKNRQLMFRLRYALPECQIQTTADLGWPTESIEGGAFALLAAYRYWGLPGNLPSVTGAKHPVLLGKITE